MINAREDLIGYPLTYKRLEKRLYRDFTYVRYIARQLHVPDLCEDSMEYLTQMIDHVPSSEARGEVVPGTEEATALTYILILSCDCNIVSQLQNGCT
jgi:hypothetical protein